MKGLHLDSDSNVFAFMTHLNFHLENEIDPFKSIFEGVFFIKSAPSFQTFSLIFELACSLFRDLPPSKRFFKRL